MRKHVNAAVLYCLAHTTFNAHDIVSTHNRVYPLHRQQQHWCAWTPQSLLLTLCDSRFKLCTVFNSGEPVLQSEADQAWCHSRPSLRQVGVEAARLVEARTSPSAALAHATMQPTLKQLFAAASTPATKQRGSTAPPCLQEGATVEQAGAADTPAVGAASS